MLALSGLVAGELRAQAITTASLHGVVRRPDSVGIEAAVITVTNTANGERWRAYCPRQGSGL